MWTVTSVLTKVFTVKHVRDDYVQNGPNVQIGVLLRSKKLTETTYHILKLTEPFFNVMPRK